MKTPSEFAMEVAAQAWCAPETSDIEMDTRLATAFARSLDGWLDCLRHEAEGCAFYRGLLDKCAESLGADAYTADDGSVMESPVRLKIPELVEALARRVKAS